MLQTGAHILIDKSAGHAAKPKTSLKTVLTSRKKTADGETFAKVLEKIRKKKNADTKLLAGKNLKNREHRIGNQAGIAAEKQSDAKPDPLSSRKLLKEETSLLRKASRTEQSDLLEKEKNPGTNIDRASIELPENLKMNGEEGSETNKLSDENNRTAVPEEQKSNRSAADKEWSVQQHFSNEKNFPGNEAIPEISRSGKVEVLDRRRKSARTEKSGDVHNLHRLRSDNTHNPSSVTENYSQLAVVEADLGSKTDGLHAAKSETGSVAELLARRLEGQTGNEIVQQVKLILNRSNAGEIHINLKPEHLGRVRMRIKLEDGHLTGRIFVESAAANQAFRSSLINMQEKLVENGFSTANFDLTWDRGQENTSSDQKENHEEWENTKNTEHVVHDFEASAGRSADWIDGRINMIA